MKRKIPQFVIRYANNKKDRIWNDRESIKETSDKYKKIEFAVLDYEFGKIEIDDCMKIISEV